LYVTDDGDLCLDCLVKGFKTVAEKEWLNWLLMILQIYFAN
jgi:hypothetical protein